MNKIIESYGTYNTGHIIITYSLITYSLIIYFFLHLHASSVYNRVGGSVI